MSTVTMSNVAESKSEEHEEDERDEDTVGPLCTCGQHLTGDGRKQSGQVAGTSSSPSTATGNSPTWLESSFVHLLAPRNRSSTSKHSHPQMRHQHGFLEAHQHLQQLINVATMPSSEISNESLCTDCLDRVVSALESDTNRLFLETQAYNNAVDTSKQRAAAFQNMVSTPNSNLDLEQTERTYRAEIDMLMQEVEAREAELAHLSSLYEEQLAITRDLDALDDDLQQQQNALELEARSFDNSVQLKTAEMVKVQTEVDRLFHLKLPQALFDLQVDERGLRYPLINQLRLAYQPKGDVPPKEVQVAWSQATQLLLMLGTLVDYPSSDWKLVPLSDCAKLIYRKKIFNLIPGDCASLMAWNALLDQVVKHAASSSVIPGTTGSDNTNETEHRFKPPPFVSSSISIGATDLTQLDRNDHVGWSQVIHRMASNLLWLSECTSERVAAQVGSLTHCIV